MVCRPMQHWRNSEASSNTKYNIQNTKYKIQSTKYKIQSAEYKVQNIKYQIYLSDNTNTTQAQIEAILFISHVYCTINISFQAVGQRPASMVVILLRQYLVRNGD